jgi:hypothetical protein
MYIRHCSTKFSKAFTDPIGFAKIMEFNLLLVWLTQTPFKRQVYQQTLGEK